MLATSRKLWVRKAKIGALQLGSYLIFQFYIGKDNLVMLWLVNEKLLLDVLTMK